MNPRFSIIIPVVAINDYVRETVPIIQGLEGPDWELFINTNEPDSSPWPDDSRIRMVHSGRVGPADKRDQCADLARGEILVFLDDDSYPNKDFLLTASELFARTEVQAAGGPAITPPEDSFKQKVSGAVFSSRLTGGNPERYRPVGAERFVNDWPSVNFLIRREVFLSVGGFSSPYWPGEDTFLCNKLLLSGVRVLYSPQLIVWHHRREGLRRHLQQVGNYGRHRGYFVRKYPENSRRLTYFIPSAFIASVIVCAVLGMVATFWLPLGTVMSIYSVGLIAGSVHTIGAYGPLVAVAAVGYTVLTHVQYGIQFLRGLLTNGTFESRLR